MPALGVFDPDLVGLAWSDSSTVPRGWFDRDDIDAAPTLSPITGALTKTLDDLTSNGTGSLEITGSQSVTLDDLTLVAIGSLEITGALTKTLDDLTSVGAGSLEITGSLNLTLDPLTSVSNGSLEITGSSSKTLDDVTLVATGTMPYPTITGSSTITLADTTLVAAGTLSTPGVGMDIGSVSVDAAGVVSGTGLAREIYDALLTQYAPTFPNPASPPSGVTISSSAWSTVATAGILSQKQSLARRATAYASAIVLHIQTNALTDLGTGAIS